MRRLLTILVCFFLVITNIEFKPVFAATVTGYNYLNNGYIQFTDNLGTDWRNLPSTLIGNAINDYGNLNNPYYFNGSVWRPLTYNRKMEYAVSEGGTLVSESDPYNVSGGTIVYPASYLHALSNFTIDGSGIIMKEQATTAGNVTYTGTMISKGEFTINGKVLEFTNTYTLLEGKSFVRVKTKITNVSELEATNVRYWVGTGDDWISTDDRNYKSRGNIIDGAFVTSANSSVQSKAIRVDTQSRSDSILFYSTHPNANTAIAGWGPFSNVVNVNPINSTVNTLNDGSYAMFVNLGTIASGASQEFDWYYAAGSAATILDTINDVALDSSGASNVTPTSATVAYTSETTTTGYYIVVPTGSSVPTANQIIGTEEYTAATVVKRGNSVMEAGVETAFNIDDLAPGTSYDLYFVTRNTENVTSGISLTRFSTQANAVISLFSITTIDIPKNHRVPDVESIETDEYTASVSWSPSDEYFENGVVYTATITITPKLGYTLTGVPANAFTVTGATATNSINEGVISAVYPAVPLDSVSFDSNGGSSISSVEYDYDALISEPLEVSRQGYEFAGWYEDDESFLNPWDFSTDKMPSSNLTLYAKWIALDQTLTFKANGGVGSDLTQVAKTDSTTTLSSNTFTRAGYSFVGWARNSSASTADYTNSQSITWFNTNTTLYAIWSANNQTITFSANGGVGSNTTQIAKTDSSTALNLNTFTKQGYSFSGWSQNSFASEADYTDGQTITWFSNNAYFYAVWTADDQTITFKANGGVGDDTTQVAKSDSLTLLDINPFTKPGHTFVGWSLDSDASEATYLNQQEITWFKEDTTFYAVWSINYYTINFIENGGSTVSNQSIMYNTPVTLPSNPTKYGYTFLGWVKNDETTYYNFSDLVMEDFNLSAKWRTNVYSITYDLAGGTGDFPSSYTIVDSITLGVPVRLGYRFNGWLLNGNPVNGIASGTTGELIFVATWVFVPRNPELSSVTVSDIDVDSALVSVRIVDFGNPRAVNFGFELTNLDTNTIVDYPTDSKLSLSLSNLDSYTNYSVRAYVNVGSKVIYTESVEFKTQLVDTDEDGIPDTRDNDPEDTSKTTSYDNVSYTDSSALTLTGDLDASKNAYSVKINPSDLIDLEGDDTITIMMGSIEYTIPVALVDDLFSTNDDSYLELVVHSVVSDSGDFSILDSVNMSLVHAYDYRLFLVQSDGSSTQVHTFNGKIKVSIKLEEEQDPANMEVYYFDETTNTLETMDAEFEESSNSLVFYTDHFSYYILGVKQGESVPYLWFGLGFIVIIGFGLLLFKRKKSNQE